MHDLRNYSVAAPAPVTLTGRFVTIEPYEREKHVDALWEALGGASGINEMFVYFPNDDFTDVAAFADWLEEGRLHPGLAFTTLVFRANASGRIVGMGSYMRPDAKNGAVEMGTVAHGPAMRRSPLATEAHYLLARHVFEGLGYRRYEWKCHDGNEASKTTARRYGFTFEGLFRQHAISKGANRDTAWFSIIDGEWSARRDSFEAWLSPENFDHEGRQKRRLEDIRAQLDEGRSA